MARSTGLKAQTVYKTKSLSQDYCIEEGSSIACENGRASRRRDERRRIRPRVLSIPCRTREIKLCPVCLLRKSVDLTELGILVYCVALTHRLASSNKHTLPTAGEKLPFYRSVYADRRSSSSLGDRLRWQFFECALFPFGSTYIRRPRDPSS